MARSWYAYDGVGDVNISNSYTILPLTFKPTCANGRIVCAIYAITEIGSEYIHPPSISFNMSTYIAAGQATGNAQPQFPINSKKYVYFLPI